MKKESVFDKERYAWATIYRPKTINEMALAPPYREEMLMIEDMGYIPNSIILHGSPGCGKTTLARILGSLPEYSLHEIDCGEDSSKKNFQTLVGSITSGIVSGERKRLVFLDEFNKLQENTQQTLNAAMEDTAKTNTFIIATNYLNNITPQLNNRCKKFHMNFCVYDDKQDKVEMFTKDHGMNKSDWIKELRRAARLVARKTKVKVPVEIFEMVEENGANLESVRGYMRSVGDACMKNDYNSKSQKRVSSKNAVRKLLKKR